MEHKFNQHVQAERMHPSYVEREQAFRTEAGRLWQEEERTRASIRANTALSEAERQDLYRVRYADLERRFNGLAQKFSAEVTQEVSAAQETLNRGTGDRFAEHLTAVSGVTDEKLPEILALARRSGQTDLQRAVALSAYERGQHKVWRTWAEGSPELAEAVEVIRGVPGAGQFDVRVRAMRPPRHYRRTSSPQSQISKQPRRRPRRRTQHVGRSSARGEHFPDARSAAGSRSGILKGRE